jgi:peptidylprolyl isomerase
VRSAPEFTAAAGADTRFEPLPDRDVYAPQVGFLDGFPAGARSALACRLARALLRHGRRGRDDPPESDGTEMYAVIGHAPRQLDRNVALVGRVLKGMELLSSLPRGSGEMGFYVPPEPHGAHPLGAHRRRRAERGAHADRGAAHRQRHLPRGARATPQRHEPWFKFNPGHIDLCNVPLPVRAIPSASR